jgi:hypothetical protein
MFFHTHPEPKNYSQFLYFIKQSKLGATTLGLMTFSIKTLSLMTFSISKNEVQNSARWHSMHSFVELSAANKKPSMLSTVVLNVVAPLT